MEDKLMATNRVYIEGKVASDLTFSHEMFGEGFYNFSLEVPRLSETVDILPITISERLTSVIDVSLGSIVSIEGQLRSYNKFLDGANRLILTVFARDVRKIDEISKSPNQIFLDGFICKAPNYRTTPFGREITDLLIAVNRPYNKSDYIPAIAWGRNAKFSSILEVGSHVKLWGRIQSREYEKKLSEESIVKRTAYEVSISKMEMVKDEENDGDALNVIK
ncbi:Single-strand binding protein family protein [Caloramator quimbayensis]|uniref:Single-strand binding protein family protein n=1 Tax=Caloramator quimbayensis TaxID=1147123 RepID=A0A1T4XJC6_9CLOT|nr:single-stranded DNA-binding protein [Caloramator quimbayensis]SKA89205.1 Single-strand binding protein family protein [Caloramator quimbayensis]